MERAEAEAIFDAGPEACVEFLVEPTARNERQVTRLEARIERLEEKLRESSRTPRAHPRPTHRPSAPSPSALRALASKAANPATRARHASWWPKISWRR